jgi:hypothetical protein
MRLEGLVGRVKSYPGLTLDETHHEMPVIFVTPFNCTRTGRQEDPKPLAVCVESRQWTDHSVNKNQYTKRFSNVLVNWDVEPQNNPWIVLYFK